MKQDRIIQSLYNAILETGRALLDQLETRFAANVDQNTIRAHIATYSITDNPDFLITVTCLNEGELGTDGNHHIQMNMAFDPGSGDIHVFRMHREAPKEGEIELQYIPFWMHRTTVADYSRVLLALKTWLANFGDIPHNVETTVNKPVL